MEPLRVYNLSHLGDALFDSMLLNRLDRPIEYFTHPANVNHVWEWFAPHVTLTRHMPEDAVEIWVGQTTIWKARSFRRPHPTPHIYNQLYLDHWRWICESLDVQFPFETREDICHVQPELHLPGEEWDWLVVNSKPLSNQLDAWDESRLACMALRLPGRVITTHPVPSLPCTRDLAPSLWNIGQLATRCRFIVGINTGPLIACLSVWTLAHAERIIVVDREHGFQYGGKVAWCRNLDEFEATVGRVSRLSQLADGSPATSPSPAEAASEAHDPARSC